METYNSSNLGDWGNAWELDAWDLDARQRWWWLSGAGLLFLVLIVSRLVRKVTRYSALAAEALENSYCGHPNAEIAK